MALNQDDDLGWLVGPLGSGDVDVAMDDNLGWAAAIPGAYNADPPLANPMDLDQPVPFDIDPTMVSDIALLPSGWSQPMAPAAAPLPSQAPLSGGFLEPQMPANELFDTQFDYNMPPQVQIEDHGHRSLFRKFQNGTNESPQPLMVSARSPDNNSDISHLDDPLLALHHELSPLTTTTSHTPSLSSMHSAQPLFFLAQQYFSRNSMETGLLAGLTNEYFARPLIDLGKLVRSVNGGPMLRYQLFLFLNIIPFMGERNQQQQSDEFYSPPVIPPEQLNQQRHLIRNIFNKAPPPTQPQPQEDDLAMVDIPNVDDSKVKKPKRSIFMRFKALNVATKEGAPLEEVIDEEDEPMTTEYESSEAPDYGALFENVLKRKGKPLKPRKNDEGSGGDGSEQHSLHEAITNALGLLVGQQSQTTYGLGPAPTLAAALVILGESYEDAIPQPEGAFAAGKRILGAKLINRKKAVPPNMSNSAAVTMIDGFSVAPTANGKPVATMISKGVEVEVDLKLLDLPPDTQIFPTNVINQKNRTRGRKENKEADLADALKVYLCNYCLRRFKRQEHLKRHFRSLHTFEKPYDCPMCHKKFLRQDNLNQHLKTHKGDNVDEDNVIDE